MSASIQFLLSQSPVYWLLLAAFFFVAGVFWARVKWRGDRHLLDVANEQQSFLLAERNDALAAQAAFIHEEEPREERAVEHAVAEMPSSSPSRPNRIRIGTRSIDRNGKRIFEQSNGNSNGHRTFRNG